ncbi:MAG TPA: translation elongation factor Ts [bacterium]|nr:translation elongation factor Ts [bacterium]
MTTINAQQVKELRELTGAGMMDAKKALVDAKGDPKQAAEILRKQGLAKADKKSGRAASEGLIESYIHAGARVGVLLEINCETDFVARTDEFKQLAHDIAMHIAATNPLYLKPSDIDEETVNKEKEIYLAQIQQEGKPTEIAEKIAEGKLSKYYDEVCLLRQAFIKDPEKKIIDLIQEAIAKMGENILIGRFVRFQLGA